MKNNVPEEVKACLWSYDTDQIDLSLPDHRRRIIQNVLNRGTITAIDWLVQNFDKEEIAGTIAASPVSEWSKKSLALWSLVFHTYPAKVGRFN